MDDETAKNAKGIIKEESQTEKGAANFSLMMRYFGLASSLFGGQFSFWLVIFLHILINISTSSLSFFIAYKLSNFQTPSQLGGTVEDNQSDLAYSLTIIVIVCLLMTCLGKIVSSWIFMSINRNMHDRIVSSLIKTKMQFFDENTTGVILNRLSSDVATND